MYHVVKDEKAQACSTAFYKNVFPRRYDATIDEMNAYNTRGIARPQDNRPKRQKRTGQADSTKPASERDAGQKKNIPVDSNMALTMTWDKLASGETRVKGEFFNATVVNLIPEGAKRRGGKPGVWDGDTIYGSLH